MVVNTFTLGFLTLLLSSGRIASQGGGQEYCACETFEAICDSDEVIVMEEARYGRMQLGRCVKAEFGYLGCSADVLTLMDRICTGQQNCSLKVSDVMEDESTPCPAELKQHLWAKYSCVKTTRPTNPPEAREYCQAETFEATCDSNEVIVMEEARYGRMNLGRCVRTDFGYLGCYADVLTIMDGICSGQHTCSFEVPHRLLEETSPCLEPLGSYLWAKYRCVEVVRPESGVCHEPLTLTAPEGYLASVVSSETNCGSGEYPYVINVAPHQTVKVTLMDFFAEHGNNDPDICYVYADIDITLESGWPTTVCRGGERVRHVYTSTEDRVVITLYRPEYSGSFLRFLLKYETVGSPHT